MSEYWTKQINKGHYDIVFEKGLLKNRGFQSNWHLTTFNKIKDYLLKDIEHLDYATGPGTLLGKFSKSNSIGVDLSTNQIKFAKDKYKNFEFYTLEEFDYRNYPEKFDLITVIGLLEFLSDEEIEELFYVLRFMLKNNGKLVLTTPNFKVSLKIILLISQLIGKTKYNQIYKSKFTRSSFSDYLLKQKNFNLVKVENILNVGAFFSIFSHSLSSIVEKKISSFFNSSVGFVLFAVLTKK